MRCLLIFSLFCTLFMTFSDSRVDNSYENEFWNLRDTEKLKTKEFWQNDAQRALYERIKRQPNQNIARNVIFFLGDGMSIPTVTAARIFDGQAKGILGERNRLSFERFPYVGLSKTYCVDHQVSDSACTATAYLCGIKANTGTIGVTANVSLNDCEAAMHDSNKVKSIAGWAIDAGRAAGVVTNTRITHATPAGSYANTASRDFESDFDVHKSGYNSNFCTDIASQLIGNDVSRDFSVILGGGLKKFLPNNTSYGNIGHGERLDGQNLINEWLAMKNKGGRFVSTKEELLKLNVNETDYLLGLFDNDHLSYHIDKNEKQPLLEEMTAVAIKMLQKNKNGYFLLVEGGRIDHGHHEVKATKALDETVQFANAVERALKMTDSKDTLIVVTADHSHTMTINGYPTIGNKINGIGTDKSDIDGMFYSTLSYGNGPSTNNFLITSKEGKVQRIDLTTIKNFGSKDFQFPATVPTKYETHGGDDVAVFANGPWAHLFTGVMEQNSLMSFMGFASCLGPGLSACQT